MIDSADGNEKPKNKTQQDGSSKTPVLDNFSRDLIKAAEEGKLDPVVGRENEINRIAQILFHGDGKDSPVFIDFKQFMDFNIENPTTRGSGGFGSTGK